MESSVDSLKKDIQCSLCEDTLIEPKLLQCCHTFCKLCIKRHAELIENANVFKCPKCLSETFLPELSSVDNLKPSQMHSRMLKVLEFVESKKVCSVSGSHSRASFHCFDCNHSLCDECLKHHSIFTKDHKVVSLVETKEEGIQVMLSRETNCVHHVDKTVELFCKDCKQAICMECLKHTHEGHLTSTLLSYASTKKALLSEQLDQLKIREQETEKRFKAMEEMNNQFKESCEKAKTELNERLEEIIEVLRNKALNLVNQIDKNIEEAERMTVRGQSVLNQARGAIDYINRMIEKGIASDLIENEDLKENYIKTGVDEQFPCNRRKMIFVSNEELMKQLNVGLGTLRTVELTDHTMSSVEVECELEALKKAKLMVLTKDKTGKVNDDPSDVIDVKIIPEDNVKIEEKYVRTDGKIELELMAKVAGELTAEVKVNGNHVFNSPLVMNVKPQRMRITRQFIEEFSDFNGIAVNGDNSRIAAADGSFDCVHVFNADEDLLLTYGQGQLSGPQGLAFLNEFNLVISDCSNHRICIVNTTTGTLVKAFGKLGKSKGEFCNPCGVHVNEQSEIVVSDCGNQRVQFFSKDGDFQYQFRLKDRKHNNFHPVSTVTHRGLFYVSDSFNDVIHVFEKKGKVPTRISTIGEKGSARAHLGRPWGLAIDNDHNLLVCDRGNNRIQKFTSDGHFVGETCNKVNNPRYVTVLNDGQLLVSSYQGGVFYVHF